MANKPAWNKFCGQESGSYPLIVFGFFVCDVNRNVIENVMHSRSIKFVLNRRDITKLHKNKLKIMSLNSKYV